MGIEAPGGSSAPAPADRRPWPVVGCAPGDARDRQARALGGMRQPRASRHALAGDLGLAGCLVAPLRPLGVLVQDQSFQALCQDAAPLGPAVRSCTSEVEELLVLQRFVGGS